jgi:hypothetical protein
LASDKSNIPGHAYIDDFKLLMIATPVVVALLIVFRQAPGGGGEDHTLVVE